MLLHRGVAQMIFYVICFYALLRAIHWLLLSNMVFVVTLKCQLEEEILEA